MAARPPADLRRDALQIWQAGLEAVRSERLVENTIRVRDGQLQIATDIIDLESVGRIAVVGAGKAGAGMAAALEEALGPEVLAAKEVTGWVNVPADCVRPLARIHLHAARPAGVNEPTAAGVEGTARILEIVQSLGPDDLCLCLLSGGGSALLPAPVEGISLEDKQAVTRILSGAGANIQQLNTVRKQLSRVKGGGLARACGAGRLITLIISDVSGDPLDIIASGPTVTDTATPQAALEVLEQFGGRAAGIPQSVFVQLKQKTAPPQPPSCLVSNLIIGNNATAVEAATAAARRLGYQPQSRSAEVSEGEAEQVGRELAREALALRDPAAGADCLISGGEPVVSLAPAGHRGKGGRNQQLVLAALDELLPDRMQGIALLSGGTDGEDGPTDAAGAVIDARLAQAARSRREELRAALARNDAYHFFESLGGLIRTGPTHTNVMDVRVVLVSR